MLSNAIDINKGLLQEAFKVYGESSKEYQEAYTNWMNSIKDFGEWQNEYAAAQTMQGDVLKGAKEYYNTLIKDNVKFFREIGYSMEEIQAWASRVSGYDPKAASSAVSKGATEVSTILANGVGTSLETAIPTFNDYGSSYAMAIGEGIQNGSSGVVTATNSLVESCANSIKDKQSSWIDCGKYLVDGFIHGIKSNIENAANTAAEMAMAAYNAAKNALGINSPSKMFAELGRFADIGFANGLTNFSKVAASAAKDVGKDTVEGVRSILNNLSSLALDNIDANPTIRPVLDMSDINSGSKYINSLFGKTPTLAINVTRNRAAKAFERFDDVDNIPSKDVKTGNTYQFTQNNYSPKSLSRIDIYRQTKNQFAQMERMVEV